MPKAPSSASTPTPSDANPGDTLTYSATNLPNGITINSSTGVVIGHPQCHQLRQLRGRPDRQRRHAHRHRLASPGPSPSPPPTWPRCSAPSSPTAPMPRAPSSASTPMPRDANPGDTLTYSATNLPTGITHQLRAPASSRHPERHQLRQLRGRADRQRRHPHRHRHLHLDGHRAGWSHGVCRGQLQPHRGQPLEQRHHRWCLHPAEHAPPTTTSRARRARSACPPRATPAARC